ncbi:unnamed protein product [Ixodes pacificus]
MCAEWEANVRKAYEKSTSIKERCQFLTLFPNEMTKQQILNAVPAATKYLIDKSRKLKATNGVWTLPDPYTSNKLKESDVATALRNFLEDEMDCSIQSLNKKDVVTVNILGNQGVCCQTLHDSLYSRIVCSLDESSSRHQAWSNKILYVAPKMGQDCSVPGPMCVCTLCELRTAVSINKHHLINTFH